MADDPLDPIPDDRKLDVEVARRVFGYRWVRWSERTAGAKADEYRHGRFLAPPDHVATSHEKPTEESLSLAPAWDRFVPTYSRRVEDAMDAVDEVALFRRNVTIRHHYADGAWTVRTDRADGSEVFGEGARLPEALCHAVLDALSDSADVDEA